MTTGELLNLVEASARAYRAGALSSMIRNAGLYELTPDDVRRITGHHRRHQRLVDAVLADFINRLAAERGGNRGESVNHLKP